MSPLSKATVEALYDLAISPLLRVVTLTLSWADQQLPSQNITALTLHVLLPSPTSPFYLLPAPIEDCFNISLNLFVISAAKSAVILIAVRTLARAGAGQ